MQCLFLLFIHDKYNDKNCNDGDNAVKNTNFCKAKSHSISSVFKSDFFQEFCFLDLILFIIQNTLLVKCCQFLK